MHTAILYWYHFPMLAAVADSLVSNGLLAVISILVSNMFRFFLPHRDRIGYLLALCLLLTFSWFFLSRLILVFLVKDAPGYERFFAVSVPIRLAIAFLIIGSMILLSALWYTLKEQQEIEKRKTEAGKMAREAELFKLRQQLQPHFLFNSLNSINALIGFKPAQARHMIQQLSDFLRGTLKKEDNQWTTLEEELKHLQLYLEIEMVRFGHRLKTVIECDDAYGKMKVPAMLLQPVVENAIKFGLYDTTEAITIRIHAVGELNRLVIKVENPFDPGSSFIKKGTGFGLSSVQRRLYLVFAQQGLLQTKAEQNVFTTTLIIPQT